MVKTAGRWQSCSTTSPGEGGCAFRGARLALQPIVDAAHLVHGPIVCQGHSWDTRPTASTGPTLHRLTLSTDLGELDVIFGGERRLTEAIDDIMGQFDPPAVFVYQTCVPAMSGDDIAAVCKTASARWERPIIPVEAPGLAGGKFTGVRIAGAALLDRVIGTREPATSTPTDVVLVGDYNVRGEVTRITRLLDSIGVRVVASIPGDGRLADIARAHRARLVISHCSQSFSEFGAKLGECFNIPHLETSFYGARNVSTALRAIVIRLVEHGAPATLLEQTEVTIGKYERKLQERLMPIRPMLAARRVLLITGGVKTWSLAQTLRELGMIVVGVTAHKTSERDRRRLAAELPSESLLFEGVPDGLLSRDAVDVVLGGGVTRYAAAAARIPWVEINHERRIALTCYDGVLELADAVATAMANPIWLQLQGAAPW